MNYAPYPREHYIDSESGIGLGNILIPESEWNLLCLSSRALFSWEDNKIPMDDRDGTFDQVTQIAVRSSLKQRVNNILLKDMVDKFDPVHLLAVFNTAEIEHLDIVKRWGSVKAYITIMEARTLVWMSVQRKKDPCQKIIKFHLLTPSQQAFVNQVNPWKNGEIIWAEKKP